MTFSDKPKNYIANSKGRKEQTWVINSTLG